MQFSNIKLAKNINKMLILKVSFTHVGGCYQERMISGMFYGASVWFN